MKRTEDLPFIHSDQKEDPNNKYKIIIIYLFIIFIMIIN
jgi:hypothetical protein